MAVSRGVEAMSVQVSLSSGLSSICDAAFNFTHSPSSTFRGNVSDHLLLTVDVYLGNLLNLRQAHSLSRVWDLPPLCSRLGRNANANASLADDLVVIVDVKQPLPGNWVVRLSPSFVQFPVKVNLTAVGSAISDVGSHSGVNKWRLSQVFESDSHFKRSREDKQTGLGDVGYIGHQKQPMTTLEKRQYFQQNDNSSYNSTYNSSLSVSLSLDVSATVSMCPSGYAGREQAAALVRSLYLRAATVEEMRQLNISVNESVSSSASTPYPFSLLRTYNNNTSNS